jgi:hypothetical protein
MPAPKLKEKHNTKLMESEHEANAPDTKWLSHEDVFGPLRKKVR